MFCGLRDCVFVVVICLSATCLADYNCVCNYKVELPVHEQSDTTSTVIGYMYEFDCKPQVQIIEESNEWFTIMFERKMGYVEKDLNVNAQVCPGGIPDTDILPTTQPSTTVTSAMTHLSNTASKRTTSQTVPVSTTLSTFVSVPPHTRVTTTTSKSTDITSKTVQVSTTKSTLEPMVITSSSSSSTTTASTQTISVSSVSTSRSSLLPVSTTTQASTAIIVANWSVTTASPFDNKLLQEKIALCRSINSSHLMTHTSINGYCYEFVTYGPRMRDLAELHCIERGGHLLSIKSVMDDEYIHKMIAQHPHLENATFWTGLSVNNNTATWTDGSNTLYTQYIHWEDGDFDGPTQCTVIKSTSTGIIWEKLDCRSNHAFICKYASTQVTTQHVVTSTTIAPTTTTMVTTRASTLATTTHSFVQGYMNLCPDQVNAQEGTNNNIAQNDTSCYVLFQTQYEWSPARAFCNNTGGHMLAINSLKEQVFIEEFLRHYGIQNGVWLGLNDLNTEGNFKWVTDEPVTFTNWNSNHDGDVVSDLHDCVVLLPRQAGVWQAMMCSDQGTNSARHLSICEYDAKMPIVSALVG